LGLTRFLGVLRLGRGFTLTLVLAFTVAFDGLFRLPVVLIGLLLGTLLGIGALHFLLLLLIRLIPHIPFGLFKLLRIHLGQLSRDLIVPLLPFGQVERPAVHHPERVGFEQLAQQLDGVSPRRRSLVLESADGEVSDCDALLCEFGGEAYTQSVSDTCETCHKTKPGT
jgi:hypothetical protein